MDGVKRLLSGRHRGAERRLVAYGPAVLTDEELVALVSGASAEAAASLVASEPLSALIASPLDALEERSGLPAEALARVLAAGELGRRVARAEPAPRPRLSTPEQVWKWALAELGTPRREEVHVLCLNPRNTLMRHVLVGWGAVDQCHVDPREVLAPAVAARASSIILVHNHPSGDPEPSAADLSLTQQLLEGAKLLCIRLTDHVVWTREAYVSMARRGLMRGELPRVVRVG